MFCLGNGNLLWIKTCNAPVSTQKEHFKKVCSMKLYTKSCSQWEWCTKHWPRQLAPWTQATEFIKGGALLPFMLCSLHPPELQTGCRILQERHFLLYSVLFEVQSKRSEEDSCNQWDHQKQGQVKGNSLQHVDTRTNIQQWFWGNVQVVW